jgi:hypothetical protein
MSNAACERMLLRMAATAIGISISGMSRMPGTPLSLSLCFPEAAVSAITASKELKGLSQTIAQTASFAPSAAYNRQLLAPMECPQRPIREILWLLFRNSITVLRSSRSK